VMECPTCFQKIVAPQVSAHGDQKLILTGTKLSDKKIPTSGAKHAMRRARPGKKTSIGPVIGLLIMLVAGVLLFVNRDKIFTPQEPATNVLKPSKSAPVAPRASDTNWTLTPGLDAIPDSPVAGRIHGQDFIVEQATFMNSTLTLRGGASGPLDFGVQIYFGGAQPGSLAGKTLSILADTNKAARVTLRWVDSDGEARRESFVMNYAMRLEFGALAGDRLPGKIHLCTPDPEKSYLLGSFTADTRTPLP
jgi:hypothetical protein